MAPVPPSAASLTVLGGPRSGSFLDLADCPDEVSIGSDPGCTLFLDLPGVSPIHARILQDAEGLIVQDSRSPHGLYVNDDQVDGQAPLGDGDVLWLGPPGGAQSVMIQCRLPVGWAPAAAMAAEPLVDEGTAAPDGADFFFEDLGPPAAPDLPGQPAPQTGTHDESVPPFADIETLVGAPPAPSPPSADAQDVFFVDESAVPALANEGAPFPLEELAIHDASFLVDAPAPVPVAAAPVPAPSAVPVPAAAPAAPAAATRPPEPAAAPARGTAPARPAPRAAASPAPVRRAAARPSPSRAPATRPAPRGVAVPRWAPLVLLGVLLLGVGGYFGRGLLATPAIDAVSPARVGAGHNVTLSGRKFASTPAGNDVRFGGRPAQVVEASSERLKVEVPELPAVPGRDSPVPVVVTVGGRASNEATVNVYMTPRVHGISPNVAMPGDEVRLSGAGWGRDAKVRFGDAEAEVLESTPAFLRVKVPGLDGGIGREVPVVVTSGADSSNSGSFVVGRLPVIMGLAPATAAPGDRVAVRGRGFNAKAASNQVQVGGARALVISVGVNELKVVVPRGAPPGEAAVELRVPGSENAGQALLTVTPLADPLELRFVAEPFEDVPGHDHAVLATGVGAAFVLTGGPARSAAERAVEAADRLNEAAGTLKASLDTDLRLRSETDPVLTLSGRDGPLLEATEQDAEAYDEDWTGLKGRGRPVTRARLAAWWEAVARDLVLLLVRGEKPRYAAALAPEGRVLGELHTLARKEAPSGIPRSVVSSARPALRDSLRIVAFRVPATVTGPGGPAAATAAGGPALRLDGTWTGSITEDGVLKYVTVVFDGDVGEITYRRALALTIPLEKVEQTRKGTVRFVIQTGAGARFYQGAWDGQKITGQISDDATGGTTLGTFELTLPR
jgi:hypothetical protein